jgi:hypothetical protein
MVLWYYLVVGITLYVLRYQVGLYIMHLVLLVCSNIYPPIQKK